MAKHLAVGFPLDAAVFWKRRWWGEGDEAGEVHCEGGVCGRKARVMKPF